jgi:putative transposase
VWVPFSLLLRRTHVNITDKEWLQIASGIPVAKGKGRPRQHSLRELCNAIFYRVRSGCAWRLLPHDFPPWKTVYHYFRQWRVDGTWERIHTPLRRHCREQAGRDPEPSAGIVASQSVKTTGVGGLRGYDGGKEPLKNNFYNY